MAFWNRRVKRGAAGWTGPPPDLNGIPVAPVDNGEVSQQQKKMHDYAMGEGLARFSVAFVADAGSRVDLLAERYVPGVGWVQQFDLDESKEWAEQAKRVNRIVDQFRGRYTETEQTVWSILWHKRSAGEVFLVNETDEGGLGVTYTPYGYLAVERQKSREGVDGYKISDKPGARLGSKAARWVPESDVLRLWTPHPDFPLLPYSALWSGLKDLDRFALFNRVIDRAANSALLTRGLVWYPAEAMDEMVQVDGKQMPKLARDYYAAAQQTMDAPNGDVAAVAPFLVSWDSDLGEPTQIKFGMPMDAGWMNMRTEAIADYARSTDMPSIMVINGGAGGSGGGSGSNHWSELLVDRRTFDMTIGRDLDALCHEDLTRYFLRPQLRAATGTGVAEAEVNQWRVGYDPTRLIVNQDRSLQVPDALRVGLISFPAAAKRLGFRQDEMAGPEDWAKLAQIVTKSTQAMDMSRFRVRQRTSDMGGGGSGINLPATAAANIRELALMAAAAEDGILWLDDPA